MLQEQTFKFANQYWRGLQEFNSQIKITNDIEEKRKISVEYLRGLDTLMGMYIEKEIDQAVFDDEGITSDIKEFCGRYIGIEKEQFPHLCLL